MFLGPPAEGSRLVHHTPRLTIFLPAAFAVLPTACGVAQPQFLPPQQVGAVQQAVVDEASGLAASRASPGVLWVHNDSGDSARVFAMNTQGTHLGVYHLTGASATDWEDMAIGPGPAVGQWYLYLGDIGDNNAVRSSIRVYRVPEPSVSPTQSPVDVNLSGVETITLQYPDGARDAETLMVDPQTRDLYLVSKRDIRSRVYRAAYPQSTTETNVMEARGELTWNWATGGDISPDGGEILIRGYFSARLWRRPAGTTVWDALQSAGYGVPVASEPQGEAICFDASGLSYFTVSEGVQPPIYFFERVLVPGDLDRDGDRDIDDLSVMVNVLLGADTNPIHLAAADVDDSGTVDGLDIPPFVDLLVGA